MKMKNWLSDQTIPEARRLGIKFLPGVDDRFVIADETMRQRASYHEGMAAHFSAASIKFLKGLARNNDRAWFDPRKAIYEQELKAPMLAVIAEVNDAMAEFAPEHVRPAPKIMMRIYRDIRFSKDKKPYKTHVSAWWARQGLEKTSGGGFYLHLGAAELYVAAGVYMPEREQLLAIRRRLVEGHEEYRALMGARKLRALMQPIDAMKMSRSPKGFAADHPANDLVLQRQWGVSSTLPAELALSPGLVKEIVKRFRIAAPLIAWLNEPLVARTASQRSRPLF
jgi:uncharacterized protein (TIGR02453 family)